MCLYNLLLILGIARLTFFGSSVCNGQGASEDGSIKHGYAWQYGQLMDARHAVDSTVGMYEYCNTSVNGINTVRHLSMLDSHVPVDTGGFVVIGLGLGNEGLHEAADKQAVYNQWKTNMMRIIRRAEERSKAVVVTNNYPRGDYRAADYGYVKAMNLEMHEWPVPTVNFLGALDNCEGNGQWAVGCQNGDDIYHPNTLGYTEMMHAIVPSLFDALSAHKAKPTRQTGEGTRLRTNQIIFAPEDTVHAFTLALRVKNIHALSLTLRLRDGEVPTLPPMPADADWHTLVITHYYAAGKTYVYLDGAQQRVTNGKMLLSKVTLSGRCTVSDLHFWRSGMNADEVAAWQAGKMLCSSLELYCPLNNGDRANLAQSTNTIRIVKQ